MALLDFSEALPESSNRRQSIPDLVNLARQAGFKDPATMGAVSFAESGGNPRAINPKDPGGSYGLTQINRAAWGPQAYRAYSNPKAAMEEAAMVYSKQGFPAWSTYKSGAYRKYLPEAEAAASQGQASPKQANLLDFSSAMPAGKSFSPKKEGGPLDFSSAMPPPKAGIEDPSIVARTTKPTSIGEAAGAEGEAMQTAPGSGFAKKLATPEQWAAMAHDPNNPMWQRIGLAIAEEGKRVGENALGAFSVFGDVAKGKASMSDPGTQQRVLDAAGWFGVRGAPGETKPVPVENHVLHNDPLGQSLTARPAPALAGAHPVGAQVTSPGPHFTIPPDPTKEYIRSEDDAFFRLRQSAVADKDQFNQFMDTIPKEIRENTALAQRLFEAHEPGSNIVLTPEEQAIYDKFGKPLDQEENDLFREAQKLDEKAVFIQEKIDRLTKQLAGFKNNPKLSQSGNQAKFDKIDKEIVKLKKQRNDITDLQDHDPEYMHRIRKGKSKEFDPWMGEGTEGHPAAGYKSMKASSQKSAVYHAIENQAGKREIVEVTDRGIKNSKGQQLTRQKMRPGDEFKVNGETWEIKRASTSEIEKAMGNPDMFYKNFWASKIKNIIQLRAVTRMIAEVDRLKSTPEFDAYSVKAREGANVPEGWRRPDAPMFHDRYLAPHLADVIDDFWKPGKSQWLPSLGKINRFLVTSLFLSPIPHATNAGVHWATARGWSWFTPKGYLSLAVDGAKAVHQVYTRGPEYQRMLREGSGLVYGSVANADFYKTMLQRLGEQVQKETPQWEKVARIMTLGASDLVKMMYNVSNRMLWLTSDVFMMQHVMELQRKGMPIRDAIAKAEKHIPNYRIPPQVMGSRLLAERLKDPTVFEFSRYHFGQFASYAHMAKDLVGKNATKAERLEAMGNVFITGVIMLALWPLINKGIQKLTGRDDLELGPKGSLTLPRLAWDVVPLAYRQKVRGATTRAMQASIGPDWASAVNDFWGKTDGQKDVAQLISQSLMLAPVPRFALEEMNNKDLFTGRDIREPGDEEKGRLLRTAAQTGEHAAGFVSPYGALSRGAFAARNPVGALGELAKQSLGLRTVPKVYHGKGGGHNASQNAAYRHAHPRGFIEELERRAEKYGGTQ